MIKILRAEYVGDWKIRLHFSDETAGDFNAATLLAKGSSLLAPLNDPAYFRQFYLELGALCWPNGLELSPAALHQELAAAGTLKADRKAA